MRYWCCWLCWRGDKGKSFLLFTLVHCLPRAYGNCRHSSASISDKCVFFVSPNQKWFVFYHRSHIVSWVRMTMRTIAIIGQQINARDNSPSLSFWWCFFPARSSRLNVNVFRLTCRQSLVSRNKWESAIIVVDRNIGVKFFTLSPYLVLRARTCRSNS